MRRRIRYAGAGAVLAAAACASTADMVPFPASDDVKIGRRYAAEIDRSAPVAKDPAINEGIARIGRKLLEASDVTDDFELAFKVVKDDTVVNALALPGGKIYVYSGLIALAGDEAEMAAVLGHAIAHVTERHSARRMTDMLGTEAMQRVIAGDESVVAETAPRVTSQGFFAFTRSMERQADDVGLGIVEKTSYDPYGMPRFFDRIAALEKRGSKTVRWFTSDHPDPGDRAARARHQIASLPPWLQTGDTNREAWLAYRDRVVAAKTEKLPEEKEP